MAARGGARHFDQRLLHHAVQRALLEGGRQRDQATALDGEQLVHFGLGDQEAARV